MNATNPEYEILDSLGNIVGTITLKETGLSEAEYAKQCQQYASENYQQAITVRKAKT